jgi:ribosomal protein S27AE
MKTALSEQEVKKMFGKDMMSNTCSKLCANCGTSNFFVGHLWEDTVPKQFSCVSCGETVNG